MLYSVVSFHCTEKRISYTYMYVPSFIDFLPTESSFQSSIAVRDREAWCAEVHRVAKSQT